VIAYFRGAKNGRMLHNIYYRYQKSIQFCPLLLSVPPARVGFMSWLNKYLDFLAVLLALA